MLNYLLYAVLIIVSINQIIKIKKDQEYDLFYFMIATCCMIIGEPLETKWGFILSIIVSMIYLFYMILLILAHKKNKDE